MRRVLIGDVGAIVRLGLRQLLADEGNNVVLESSGAEAVLDMVVEALPDFVLVDLDEDGHADLASQLAVGFPSLTVIACSTLEPTMRIFPPFHYGEFYESALDAAHLAAVLTNTGHTP